MKIAKDNAKKNSVDLDDDSSDEDESDDESLEKAK